MTCADDVHVWMTCGRHVCADDMWTMYAVDDVHVMPGVVLHEIRQLRQEERSHLEQLCIKPTGLLVIICFHFVKSPLDQDIWWVKILHYEHTACLKTVCYFLLIAD